MTFLSTVAFRATKNLEDTILDVNYRSRQRSLSELPKSCQQWELTFLSTIASELLKSSQQWEFNFLSTVVFRATKVPTTLRAEVSGAYRAKLNLEDTMLTFNYQIWKRSFLKLPKSCQKRELTFLSTVAFRATKIPKILRADVFVAFRAKINLENTILTFSYQTWKCSFLELPKSCQKRELTFLSTVAFRAIKFPTTLRADVSAAFRAT